MSDNGVPRTIPELYRAMQKGFGELSTEIQESKSELSEKIDEVRELVHARSGTLTTHFVKDRVERSDPPDTPNTPMAAKGGD